MRHMRYVAIVMLGIAAAAAGWQVLLGPHGLLANDASRVVTTFGTAGMGRGEFAYPRGLAVSPIDGRVFVVDKAARIQRFDSDGRYETEWRMPEWDNGKPTGLGVDRDNRVWVADTHYSRVIVFDRDGRELKRFGEPGEGDGQFLWPTTVAFDPDGNVFVGEYGGNDRINKFSPWPECRFILSFARGSVDEGGVSRPQGLAFDADGVLWVTDASNHRVSRYDRDGNYLGSFGVIGGGAGEFRYPYDVAVRSDQTLVISDYGNNRVVRVGRDGRTLGAWGREGRDVGCVLHAWSLDVGPNGRMYVLDSWNNRVQVVAW